VCGSEAAFHTSRPRCEGLASWPRVLDRGPRWARRVVDSRARKPCTHPGGVLASERDLAVGYVRVAVKEGLT